MKTRLLRMMPPATRRQARRLVVAVVGGTLILCGLVMIVTPGPGLLVIFGGLSVLAAEFVWARRLLRRFKSSSEKVRESLFGSRQQPKDNGIARELTRRHHAGWLMRWRWIWRRGADCGRKADRFSAVRGYESAGASSRTSPDENDRCTDAPDCKPD